MWCFRESYLSTYYIFSQKGVSFMEIVKPSENWLGIEQPKPTSKINTVFAILAEMRANNSGSVHDACGLTAEDLVMGA